MKLIFFNVKWLHECVRLMLQIYFNHSLSLSFSGDRPFRCTDCAFRAITRENLHRHIEREHENVKFPCKECDFVATNRTKLWNHQLSHLGINGLQCPHCPDKFET